MTGSVGPTALFRSARTQIARLRRLQLSDWPGVAATLAAAVVIEVGLRTVQLPQLAQRLGVPLGEVPEEISQQERTLGLPADVLRRLQISAAIMRRWPFDEKCLRMSLACGHRIRAYDPSLVVGVALLDGEVRAHAWLVVDGVSLDPSGSTGYASLRPIWPS